MSELTRIVEVEVNTTDAVKAIAEYKLELESLKKAEDDIRKVIKEKGGSTKEQQEELTTLSAKQKAYTREMREFEKEVQNNLKLDREKEGSLQALKAELSANTAAYDKLSAAERSGAKGSAFAAAIENTSQKLKDAEEELGNYHRSVGNYEKASVGLRTEIRQLTESLVAMKMAGRDNSEEYRELSARAAELNDAMGDVQQQTRGLASDTSGLDTMTQAAQGLAGAWGVYNAMLGASIEEDSEAAEVMKNLQVSMAALAALTAIQNSIQKQSILMQTVSNAQATAAVLATNLDTAAKSKNIIVSKAATAAQWLLNAAAAANPYVLLAMALLTVVGGLVLLTGNSAKAKRELAALNNEVDATSKKLNQMAEDTDFDIRIAEAMGKSEREVLDIKRESAKKQLDLADESMRDIQRLYIAANKEEKKVMQEKYDEMVAAQKQAHDQIKSLNKEYSVLEEKERTEAKNKAIEDEKKAADARKQQLDTELTAIRAQVDAQNALLEDGIAKDRVLEEENHRRKIEDLKKRLATEKNLTAKTAIQQQIEIAEKQHTANMAKLDAKTIADRLDKEAEAIALKLAAVKKGTDEEFSLRMEQLNKEAQAELNKANLTAEQRLLIEAKYQAEAKALRDQHTNDQIQKAQDTVRLEWENKIAEATLQGQNTLQLEMVQRKAELDAMQQMEGESDAAFKVRQLAAQQAYVDSKRAINDYEVQVEQAKMQSIEMVTGALGGLLEEMGENNKAFAIASKALALGEIAINTGKAIAAGTAQAQSVPFPGNLIAIATTVATVLANITTAIKTVKSAKFATGGYVDGPGTATSDSIPAQLSKGESVNNAMSTSMFTPIYSALNQLGGGIPIVATQTSNQVAGEDMLARAVAKGVSGLNMRIGVDEIHRIESRVSVVESLGDL